MIAGTRPIRLEATLSTESALSTRPRITMRFPPEFLDDLRARLPGFGGRRPSRGAQEGRARVEGALAVQQGEDAVVLRERPEGGVVRFLVGQERQHLRLRDADRGRVVPRSGRAARLDGGRAAAARRRPRPKRARSGARRCTTSSSLRRSSSKRRLRRARAPRRAAIWRIAASSRRRSCASASATRRPSASR